MSFRTCARARPRAKEHYGHEKPPKVTNADCAVAKCMSVFPRSSPPPFYPASPNPESLVSGVLSGSPCLPRNAAVGSCFA